MQQVTENARTLAEATSGSGGGVLEVEFITPGWGSSGYYSREVLEAAAPLFRAGTHMYFDHPSATDSHDRPERSVRDLAAVVSEDASVDPSTGALRGKVRPLAAYSELLTDEAFAMNVGLSIRGSATDVVRGEAEGREGPIIEGLADIQSIDFVTRAGRGGRVLQVMESLDAGTRPVTEARNIGQWVESRIHRDFTLTADDMAGEGHLTREERIGLSSAIGDALQAFVDSLEANHPQLYSRDLWDNPQDTVAAAIEAADTNVPATRPDGTTTQEDTMPQIEEARLRELEEAHGRVPTLESERDTAVSERDEARAELARVRREAEARRIIGEAEVTFTPLEQRGLLADLPVGESDELDTDRFTAQVTEAAEQVAERDARTTGTVRGFGGSTHGSSDELSESDIDNAVAGVFGRQVKEA